MQQRSNTIFDLPPPPFYATTDGSSLLFRSLTYDDCYLLGTVRLCSERARQLLEHRFTSNLTKISFDFKSLLPEQPSTNAKVSRTLLRFYPTTNSIDLDEENANISIEEQKEDEEENEDDGEISERMISSSRLSTNDDEYLESLIDWESDKLQPTIETDEEEDDVFAPTISEHDDDDNNQSNPMDISTEISSSQVDDLVITFVHRSVKDEPMTSDENHRFSTPQLDGQIDVDSLDDPDQRIAKIPYKKSLEEVIAKVNARTFTPTKTKQLYTLPPPRPYYRLNDYSDEKLAKKSMKTKQQSKKSELKLFKTNEQMIRSPVKQLPCMRPENKSVKELQEQMQKQRHSIQKSCRSSSDSGFLSRKENVTKKPMEFAANSAISERSNSTPIKNYFKSNAHQDNSRLKSSPLISATHSTSQLLPEQRSSLSTSKKPVTTLCEEAILAEWKPNSLPKNVKTKSPLPISPLPKITPLPSLDRTLSSDSTNSIKFKFLDKKPDKIQSKPTNPIFRPDLLAVDPFRHQQQQSLTKNAKTRRRHERNKTTKRLNNEMNNNNNNTSSMKVHKSERIKPLESPGKTMLDYFKIVRYSNKKNPILSSSILPYRSATKQLHFVVDKHVQLETKTIGRKRPANYFEGCIAIDDDDDDDENEKNLNDDDVQEIERKSYSIAYNIRTREKLLDHAVHSSAMRVQWLLNLELILLEHILICHEQKIRPSNPAYNRDQCVAITDLSLPPDSIISKSESTIASSYFIDPSFISIIVMNFIKMFIVRNSSSSDQHELAFVQFGLTSHLRYLLIELPTYVHSMKDNDTCQQCQQYSFLLNILFDLLFDLLEHDVCNIIKRQYRSNLIEDDYCHQFSESTSTNSNSNKMKPDFHRIKWIVYLIELVTMHISQCQQKIPFRLNENGEKYFVCIEFCIRHLVCQTHHSYVNERLAVCLNVAELCLLFVDEKQRRIEQIALILAQLCEDDEKCCHWFLLDEHLLPDIRLLLINRLISNRFNLKFLSIDHVLEFFLHIEQIFKTSKSIDDISALLIRSLFIAYTDLIATIKQFVFMYSTSQQLTSILKERLQSLIALISKSIGSESIKRTMIFLRLVMYKWDKL